MDARNNVRSSFPYSTAIVNCEGILGNVRATERNIPNEAIESYVNMVISKLTEQYKTDRCITRHEAQHAFVAKKSDDFYYEPSEYAKKLIVQNKRINRKIVVSNNSGASMLGMTGVAFCAGVFVYEAIQSYSKFRKREVNQGIKHGLVATISLVMLMMFGHTMMKL